MKRVLPTDRIDNNVGLEKEVLSALVAYKKRNSLEQKRYNSNELLQKITENDMNSLTAAEKKILDEFTWNSSMESKSLSSIVKKYFGILISTIFLMIAIGLFVYLIYAGESRATLEYGVSITMVSMISIGTIILLGLLEGSQLAIVNLSDKDLSSSAEYPIAYEIQRLTKNKELVQDYLVGRQLLVVAIVSVFSILISFPHFDGEMFGKYFPSTMNFVIFKLGLLNALVLLWFGQLMPQLFATKSPQTMINFRIMKYVVYLCLLFSKARIALPISFLLSKISHKETAPPLSDFEMFVQNSDAYKHFIELRKVDINFTSIDDAKIDTDDSLVIIENLERLYWYSVSIHGHINYQTHAHEKIETDGYRLDFEPVEAYNESGAKQYKALLRPTINKFEKNDEINLSGEYSLSSTESIAIEVEQPCRALFIKTTVPIEIIEDNIDKKLLLSHYEFNKISEEYELVEKIKLKEEEIEGNAVMTFAVMYPRPNSLYEVKWEDRNEKS